jgi:FlaA1/EpsC-like NDP-sugar epimerase
MPSIIRSKGTALIHDVLMVPVAWTLAFWLRYNLDALPDGFYTQGSQALYLLIPVQMGAFLVFGLYRGIWRFASIPDLLRILKAVGVGAAVIGPARKEMPRDRIRPPAWHRNHLW